jgi:hypothetical protein
MNIEPRFHPRSYKMRSFEFILVIVLTIFFVPAICAQDDPFIDRPILSCEDSQARLDRILMQFETQKDPRFVLVIIARLGDGEQLLETSEKRLHNAREYFLVRHESPILASSRIVTALGERISGPGRLEFYVSGRLFDRIPIKRNQNICVDCCLNYKIKRFRKGKFGH